MTDKDEPGNHRDLDAEDLRRTKAFGCSCASHQKHLCAYFRKGYCSDHGVETAKFKRPTLVIDNTGKNVIKLRP